MTPGIVQALSAERPDWALVYGDTNSTVAGAGAAAAAGVPLAHVEAGLRSGDLDMPEERNRIEVDRLARPLLCPDERSRATLAAEGVAGEAVGVGDVMADACFRPAPIAPERSDAPARVRGEPGANTLVDDDPYRIVQAVREAGMPPDRPPLYGDGHASERVAEALLSMLGGR